MKKLKLNNFLIRCLVCSSVVLGFAALYVSNKVHASADTTKPTLSVTQSTKEYTNKLTFTLKASDASGIKMMKYAKGYQTTSYFKKNGIKLKMSKNKATVSIAKNDTYTFYAIDNAGNTKIKRITIENIDSTKPTVDLGYSVSDKVATISVTASDKLSGVKSIAYLKGSYSKSSTKWANAKDISGTTNFKVKKAGFYSVLVKDNAGNATVSKIKVNLEMKAVWFSYLEFQEWCNTKKSQDYNEESFTSYIQTAFDRVVELNMNTVIVQVRPSGDAMYPSKYFPWSQYASGTQGEDPLFDPLEIMVKEAHKRNLEIQAWINPYRVSSASTNLDLLSDDNPAKKWLTDNSKTNDRNVLSYNSKLYYNPSSSEVQKLIVNGIKEIVQNYDVDGIHFDDYFYPTLGSKYASLFDSTEYKEYKETAQAAGKTIMNIADWRRNNVNTLVKKVYSAVKAIDPNCKFGISPTGAYKNLVSDQQYYVDFETWMSKSGYVDYICPQLYWAYEDSPYPYEETVDYWASYKKNDAVNLYIGVPSYKAGSSEDKGQWKDSAVLASMIEYGRSVDGVDGFMFYRYSFLNKSVCLPALDELSPLLAE